LRRHGIAVDAGVAEAACRRLNEAFCCWICSGRPFVLLKLGLTLDGRIATAGGESKWITGTRARAMVQRYRRWADAILVGGETVRRDDPSLTVRVPRGWWRQPRKLVWTRAGELPRHLCVWADPAHPPECVQAGSAAEWQALLLRLGASGVTSLLVEGGGELAAACLRAGVVDKVAFFIAPRLLGGRGSRPAVGGENPRGLADALPLVDTSVRRLGDDYLFTGYLPRN
jgi:diaminohydroxyphosphoribosylaminopyrimidine deaminase/5-amino-6-(5-phosphoribosylamino)uracil reductase